MTRNRSAYKITKKKCAWKQVSEPCAVLQLFVAGTFYYSEATSDWSHLDWKRFATLEHGNQT